MAKKSFSSHLRENVFSRNNRAKKIMPEICLRGFGGRA
jgi:hypothetical protein